MQQRSKVQLTVNGRVHCLTVGGPSADVEVTHTLAHTLRETLGLTGTKVSCDRGACGGCTVLVDGAAMLSCTMLTVACDGRSIVTVEGLADPVTGALDPLQQAFVDHTAFQCGFCTPGILMSAKALLIRNPRPSAEEVREALAGNFCRCIAHYHVLEAIEATVGAGTAGAAVGAAETRGARAGVPAATLRRAPGAGAQDGGAVSSEYRYIGHPTPRKDAHDIVTGRTNYVGDLTVPGMLHARVLRSPHPHARIAGIDATRATALPGVEAVLTHADVPDWRAGNPRHMRALDSTVRFVGDAVALVAATSEALAAEALESIEVEYEVLPAVHDIDEALAPDAPQLYTDSPGNVLRPGTRWFGPDCLTGLALGDATEGFAEADVVVEGEVSYRGLPNPLPPESPGVIAHWQEPSGVTLWLSTQAAAQERMILQHAFGHDVEVRTIGGPCGGSYGSKFMSVQLILQATALSRATGRPVKLRLTKEEHMAAFILRLGSRIRAKVGMTADGRLTAVSGEWLIDTGCFSFTTQAQVAVGLGEAQLALRCPNWDLRTTIVCTNRAPSGIVRGFGGQELKACLLPLLNPALERLDLDPFEFLKRNYVKPGDGYYWRDGRRYTCRGNDYSAAMEAGADAFGWREKWKGWLRPTTAVGRVRTGVGVGVHGNVDIGESVSEAWVRLDPRGAATIHSPASEHGTGQPSNLCKMVAEVLQLPLERVSLTPADTAVTPFDMGPVGSRGTYAMGTACILAAEEARRQLLDLATARFGVPADELDTCDGRVFVAHEPADGIGWQAVMGTERTIVGAGRFEPDFALANCLMTFVEVQVDTETGKVDLVQVVNATDVGQVIDPPGLENQLNGCLGSAGIDTALFEETVLDRSTGRMLDANMIDYKWRTFVDLPAMRNIVLETPVDSHRFKAIGVGEVATAPGPAAVLMAVSNAVGVHLSEYPVSPHRILRALRASGDPQPAARPAPVGRASSAARQASGRQAPSARRPASGGGSG